MKMKALVLTTGILSLVLFMVMPVSADSVPLLLPGIGTVRVSDVLVEPFELPDAWETYSSLTGVDLGVENGVYRAFSANAGYVWGLNAQEHTDLVAEVEVTPLTPFTDIGAGVMCRADVSNNGDGYYFMINANGYYSIQVGRGDEIVPLVDWQPSAAIHSGIDQNTIRAVCLEEQLVMYVNEQLVASVEDATYGSGYAGLAVAAGDNGVDMAFDNLSLYTIQHL